MENKPTDEITDEEMDSSLPQSQVNTVLESESTQDGERGWIKTRKRRRTKKSPNTSPQGKISKKKNPADTGESSFSKPRGPARPLDKSSQDKTDTPKPPPIYLRNVTDFKKLCTKLLNITGANKFSCKSRFNDVVINTVDTISYRTIIRYLNDINADFHCYQLKEDKAYRVVIRNLHHSTPIDEIKSELASKGYNIKNVHNVKHPATKSPLPLFFIDLAKEPRSKDIFKEQYLLYTKIKVEEPRRSKDVPQCHKCLEFGHTQNYCGHTPRCVKCGEEHPTSDCVKPTDTPAKCANCGKGHVASYKGCEIYKAVKVLRNRNNPPKFKQTVPKPPDPSFWTSQPLPSNQLLEQQPSSSNLGSSRNPSTVSYAQAASQPTPKPIPTNAPLPLRQPPSRSTRSNQPSSTNPSSLQPNTPPDLNSLFTLFFSKLESLINPLITLITSFMTEFLPRLIK